MFEINVNILSLIPNPAASSLAFHIGKKFNLEIHTDHCSRKITKRKQFLLEQGTFQTMNAWPIWIMHSSTHISSTVIISGSILMNNFFETANSVNVNRYVSWLSFNPEQKRNFLSTKFILDVNKLNINLVNKFMSNVYHCKVPDGFERMFVYGNVIHHQDNFLKCILKQHEISRYHTLEWNFYCCYQLISVWNVFQHHNEIMESYRRLEHLPTAFRPLQMQLMCYCASLHVTLHLDNLWLMCQKADEAHKPMRTSNSHFPLYVWAYICHFCCLFCGFYFECWTNIHWCVYMCVFYGKWKY